MPRKFVALADPLHRHIVPCPPLTTSFLNFLRILFSRCPGSPASRLPDGLLRPAPAPLELPLHPGPRPPARLHRNRRVLYEPRLRVRPEPGVPRASSHSLQANVCPGVDPRSPPHHPPPTRKIRFACRNYMRPCVLFLRGVLQGPHEQATTRLPPLDSALPPHPYRTPHPRDNVDPRPTCTLASANP